jgi:hypothetical protein
MITPDYYFILRLGLKLLFYYEMILKISVFERSDSPSKMSTSSSEVSEDDEWEVIHKSDVLVNIKSLLLLFLNHYYINTKLYLANVYHMRNKRFSVIKRIVEKQLSELALRWKTS